MLPETRVQLAYGGADLTRFLGELLVRAKFPYRELDVRASIADTLLLDELKRRLVTLNPADVGLNIHDFTCAAVEVDQEVPLPHVRRADPRAHEPV